MAVVRTQLFLVVLATLCVASSCGPLGNERPAGAGVEDPAIATAVETRWWYAAADAGGYEGLEDLFTPSSLYATSWNLQLSALYGIAVPNLSQAETARWLLEVVDSEPAVGENASPLTRWLLAARGLQALGHTVPADRVLAVLESTRSGGQYAPLPGGSPSWSATLWAVELMELAGLAVPQETRQDVSDALVGVTDGVDARNVLNTVIPVWHLADRFVAADVRARQRSALQEIVSSNVARAISGSPDGVAIGVVLDLQTIAKANDLNVPALPRDFIERLRSSNGYLTLGVGYPVPEPQVTFHAARLGVPANERLIEIMRVRASRNGWPAAWAEIDPATTYFGLLAMRAVGQRHREAQLSKLAAHWLTELTQAAPTDDSDRALSRRFFVIALARALALPVPASAAAVTRSHLDAELQPEGTVSGVRRLAWLVRTAAALGLATTATDRARLAARVGGASLDRMDDVYRVALVARYAGAAEAQARALQRAREWKAPSAGYLESQDAKWPDLLATCAGLSLLGGTRADALEPFMTPSGAVMQPVASSLSRWLSIQTIYLGLVTAGRIANEYDLCYM